MTQESVIISELGDTVLTQDYVNISYSAFGIKKSMTIFLKDVSSVIYQSMSNPIFIILAILSFILGIIIQCNSYSGSAAFLWGFIIAIVFVVLYVVTQKQFVIITAHSGQKIIQMINEQIKAKKFVEDVIEAKKNV